MLVCCYGSKKISNEMLKSIVFWVHQTLQSSIVLNQYTRINFEPIERKDTWKSFKRSSFWTYTALLRFHYWTYQLNHRGSARSNDPESMHIDQGIYKKVHFLKLHASLFYVHRHKHNYPQIRSQKKKIPSDSRFIKKMLCLGHNQMQGT